MNFSKIYQDFSSGKDSYYRIIREGNGYRREWVRGHTSYVKPYGDILREGAADIETDWLAEDWEAFKMYLRFLDGL